MKINPYYSLLVLLGVLLAGCAPQSQSGSPQSGETEKTLYVGPQLADCVGVAAQKCLQVKDSPDGEYRLFYDQIEGFEFEEGHEYVLLVTEVPIENPPADGSALQYRLIKVISSVPSSAPPADPGQLGGDLQGQVWTLESYLNNAGSLTPVLQGSQVTAEFNDGQLSGNAGCNNYFASYQLNGNAIQISGAGSTEMFCTEPEGVMDQESAYLKALGLAATYQISTKQLEITDASGEPILIFVAAEPVSLTEVVWQMTMVNNGKEAVVSALDGVEVTASFGEDGSLTGSAGCNRYTAGYKQDGESLTISPAASTLMMCSEPDGVMEQEAAYLKALESVASFELHGDRLTLRTASGAIAVEFSLSDSASLSGTAWQLSLYYVGGDAVTSPLAGTTLTANFAEDGKLTGSAGCNSYSSDYQVDGDSLSIGPVASTKKLCTEPPGVMEQEAAFLVILENTAGYQINADTLILLDAEGAPLAEFSTTPPTGVVWEWQEF